MRICFDLDGTLCTGKPYEEAQPIPGASLLLKKLKSQGHIIVIQTARGMGSSKGNVGKAVARIAGLTLKQLEEWGFEYDEIFFGKPDADLFVDDKSLNVLDYTRVASHIKSLENSIKKECSIDLNNKINSLFSG